MTDRDEKIAELQDEIEKNLKIVGSTGIEDLLGDKVGETIKLLREADIKIWLLTGDKTETAINVGYSCNLIEQDYRILTLDALT